MSLEKLKIHEAGPEMPELEKIAAEEAGVLRKLGKKAKGVARVLTFFTAVSVASCSLPKLNKEETGPKKPAYTAEETETGLPQNPLNEEINAESKEAREIMALAESDPIEFFGRIPEFKENSKLNLAPYVRRARQKAPEIFFNNIDLLGDIPGLDLLAEIKIAAHDDPGGFYLNIQNLRNIPGLDLAEQTKEAAAASIAHPWVFLNTVQYIPKDISVNLTPEVISICNNIPQRFIGSAHKLKNVMAPAEWQEQLEKSFALDPEAIKSYGKILKDIKQPKLDSTRVLQTINDWQASLLLNEMVKHGLSEERALEITKNENELFKTLVKIKSEPDHVGQLTVEKNLQNTGLRITQRVNDLHEKPDAIRFKSVNDASPEELYSLMVYGEEEVFTSTFNGFFNRMIAGMRDKKLSGEELLKRVNNNKFRILIKECANFNRLNEFLKTMDEKNAHALLTGIVKDLDAAEDKLAQAATVADIFGVITDQETLIVLQEQIKLSGASRQK